MERNGIFRELVQEKKKEFTKDEIFESAFYKEMLLSVAGELTGGTLKKVELVKLPESDWAGRCNDRRVLLNIENSVTASFPSVSLKSDSIAGVLGHECGHWNFSDFGLRQKYLEGIEKGEWYLHPPKPETSFEEDHLKEINEYLEQKHDIALALLAETASFIQNMLEDVYVEQKMCERYPGSIRRGIMQNRVRNVERIPSLKVQMENGYRPVSILLNLMAQYSLAGIVNNWEEVTGGLLELLELVKPVIDAAVKAEDAKARMSAANRILLIIWKVLLEEIQEAGDRKWKQQGEEPQNQPEGDGQPEAGENPEEPQDSREKEVRLGGTGKQTEEPQSGQEQAGQPGESKEQPEKSQKGPEQTSQSGKPQEQSEKSQKSQEQAGQSGGSNGQPGEPQDSQEQAGQSGGLNCQPEEPQDSQEQAGQSDKIQNQQEEPADRQAGERKPGEHLKKNGQNLQERAKEQEKRQEGSPRDHTEKIQRMLEQLREQLPEFLLEKDGENVEGNLKRMGEVSRVNTLLPMEQLVETGERLMEYIQGAAEKQAEKELEQRFSRELSRELSETEFDGDHRKVKKVLVRENRFSKGAMTNCNLYEDQVRAIMRRMKARLLPVLSCQSPHMERNLFFGSQMNYQALYNPEKRIFCNLEVRKKVNTAVAMLIDMSGSMLGKRMEQARLCTLCLYEFCKSAGIPILIYGHHTDRVYKRVQNETVYLHSLAEFDSDYKDKYRIAGMKAGGCNRDGAAIAFVGEKLAKRPEKIKLFFLISDGFPNATCYNGKKAEEDLLKIKEKLEKKRITMLTVAIGEDKEAIQRIYQEGFLDISDLEQLPYLLPKQILKYIRR
nr:hypothetical protein [uncultured Schaedlerella sp.]